MTTSWTIAIDWDRNGNFSDTDDDVTSRVIEAKWFLGQQKPYQDVADNSVLTLVLDNSDKRFSPDYAASPLLGKVKPFRPVRIQSYDGVNTYTHWVGWIESFKPAVNPYGKRTVEILANGPMQFFMAAETKLKLQENKRSDEIVAELIKEVVFPPALTEGWIMGRVGYSEMTRTTRLANITAYSDLDAGQQRLDLAADNWVRQGGMADTKQDTFEVYRAINDVTAAERGKFLFSREGKALFWNRHHLLDDEAVAAILDNTMQGMEYVYAGIDHVKNEVIVTCHPRTVSPSTNDILWQLADKTLRVDKDKPLEMFVKYEDESKNRVGGRNVTYTDLEFESGTASPTLDPKANGAELKFTNTLDKPAIIKKLIIRGQKIVDDGEMEARATDNASIIDYGRRTLKMNIPSVGSLEAAQTIADFERRRRGQPRGDVASVKLVSHSTRGGGQHAQQLARTLGDLVRIQEAQTAHDARYYIIGEMHRLFNAGEVLETTWYLERQTTYSASGVPEIQPDKLLAYWKLADESGTSVYDSSGYSRHGMASGVSWGQIGIGDGLRAARFDGVNDHCAVYSSSLNAVWNGQEFTLAGWFKVPGAGVWTDGQTRTLVSFRNTDTPVDSIIIRKDSANNQLTCEYSANGVTKSVTVSSYSATGWVHFAVTVSYSGNAFKFYLDGVQQGSTQTGLGQWNNAQGLQSDITLGAGSPSTHFWSGDLAHVAVWNAPLLTGEVFNLAKAVTPMFPWKLGVDRRSRLGATARLTY